MRTLLLLASLTLPCAVLAQDAVTGGPGGLVPYLDPAAVARGATLYAEHCAACHGDDLEGQPDWQIQLDTGRMPAPPHDVTGHTWHHADELLFRITKYGISAVVGNGYESDMRGFGDVLSDVDILETLAFIKSSWPKPVQERHNRVNAANAGR